MENMFCPQCNRNLVLKQINLTEAIYMCINLSCSYPTNSRCYVVQRKLEDIKKFNKNPQRKNISITPSQEYGNLDNKGQDFDLDSLISSTLMTLNSSSIGHNEIKIEELPDLSNINAHKDNEGVDLEEIFNSLDNS